MNDAKMDGRNGTKKGPDWYNINKYTFDCDLKGGIWYSGVTFIGDKGKTNGTPSAAYSTADTHIFLPAAGYRNASVDIQKASESHYWSSSLSEYLI